MRWWVRLLRLRKQNDVVKVMFLFFVLGLVFLGNAINSGIHLSGIVKEPVEYVMQGAMLDARISELEQLENVTAVSRQIEGAVAVKYNAKETTISFVELSKEYIETSYGIKDNGVMKTFYMNKTAYNNFKRSIEFTARTKTVDGEYTDEGIRVSYVLNEQPQSEGENQMAVNYGMAKVVLVEIGSDDKPYVFCVGESIQLNTVATGVRVRVGQQDLDGMNLKRMQGVGFYVSDEMVVMKGEYQQEIQVLKIKFHVLLAAICLISVAMLGKYGKIKIE